MKINLEDKVTKSRMFLTCILLIGLYGCSFSWAALNMSEEQLRSYYDDNFDMLDPIEGIWKEKLGPNKIGIKKDYSQYTDYVAFFLEFHRMISKWEIDPNHLPTMRIKETVNPLYYYCFFDWLALPEVPAFITIQVDNFLQLEMQNPSFVWDEAGRGPKTFVANYVKIYPTRRPAKAAVTATASGFLLSNSGLFITNYHIVEEKSEFDVVFPESNTNFKAELVLKDIFNDIAILKLKGFNYNEVFNKNIPYVVVTASSLKQGQDVVNLGYPFGDLLGKSAKLSKGIISSLFGIGNDPRLLQISNPIQPGNSGGPLLTTEGDVVGIVVASLNAKLFFEYLDVIPQNVNFSVKSDYLINLLMMLPEYDEIKMRSNLLKGKSLDVMIEEITPFIGQIRSY